MDGLREIPVHMQPRADSAYSVFIGRNIQDFWTAHLRDALSLRSVFILTDRRVEQLWGEAVTDRLRREGFRVRRLSVPSGEESKTWERAREVLESMLASGMDRNGGVVALGGGVVGDLAGFCASVFMRGVVCVQVPTTLVAQVDSSIGGKTAVDLSAAKNAVGAFHQPGAVYTDTVFLETLPAEEVLNGMAEVIKYGAIRDRELFERLEDHKPMAPPAQDPDWWVDLVARCAGVKCDIVGRDERDAGERMILNFGHTAGHALEISTDFQLSHGRAVAVGMCVAARLSRDLGVFSVAESDRLESLLRHWGLPTVLPAGVDPERMLATMRMDKKRRDGKSSWVVLRGIGVAEVAPDVQEEAIRAVLKEVTP